MTPPGGLEALRARAQQWLVTWERTNCLRSETEAEDICRDLVALPSDQDLINDLLIAYADDLTKEASDHCDQCGVLMLCPFHSLLSALSREVQP